MTDELLQAYLRDMGLVVEVIADTAGTRYTMVRDFIIPVGPLAGRTCDVAMAQCASQPYLVASAVHTRPALVRMDMMGALKTQPSPLGAAWQYWSRRFDRTPTPRAVWTHILTVLGQVTDADVC